MAFVGDLLVLDADGVVFSAEVDDFAAEIASRSSNDVAATMHRWRTDLAPATWRGELTPVQLWAALAPEANPAELSAELERRYEPGPMFGAAASGRHPVWIVANDRSGWLLPRLRRFGLTDHVERVIVSDQIGSLMSDPPVLDLIGEETTGRSVTWFTDDPMVLHAACERGIDAGLPPGLAPTVQRAA